MITVRESKFIKFENGVSVEIIEIDIGSASELPTPDFIDGKYLYQGSIAHDVSTGDFYCIDSEGTWYNQDGSGAYVPNAVSRIVQADVPVEMTEERYSEGTGEIMTEIPPEEILSDEESSSEKPAEKESVPVSDNEVKKYDRKRKSE